jgi:DNA-directed RNA polymerase subunit RPC12/RpoP
MVKTYKCPNCGADMVFDADKQILRCHHCQTEKTITSIEDEEASKKVQTPPLKTAQESTEDFKMFHCPTCGAEVLTDLNTAATFCSYCGSPTLIESRLTGVVTPDYIIPFKTSLAKAKEAYKRWTRKGLFVPSSFSSQNTIEKITGIYVPFWLYDYHSKIQLDAHCTRTRRRYTSNTEYIYTDHYRVYRDIEADFLKVPADASEKMDDTIMDQLEPFNYSELTDFQMPFLSGYQAEKYNFSSEHLIPRIEQRVDRYISDVARTTIQGYDSTMVTSENTQLHPITSHYSLFPVWVLNYRYKNKNYSFTMNGQTGKVVANLPISYGKVCLWFFLIFVVIFIIAAIIGSFIL